MWWAYSRRKCSKRERPNDTRNSSTNGATICGPRPAIASIMQRTLSSLESSRTPSRSKCTDSRPRSREPSDWSGMRPDRLVHELGPKRHRARAPEEPQHLELLADPHRGVLEELDVGRV